MKMNSLGEEKPWSSFLWIDTLRGLFRFWGCSLLFTFQKVNLKPSRSFSIGGFPPHSLDPAWLLFVLQSSECTWPLHCRYKLCAKCSLPLPLRWSNTYRSVTQRPSPPGVPEDTGCPPSLGHFQTLSLPIKDVKMHFKYKICVIKILNQVCWSNYWLLEKVTKFAIGYDFFFLANSWLSLGIQVGWENLL
jgi:hypothetical protein